METKPDTEEKMYLVEVREVFVSTRLVSAQSEKEAIELIKKGGEYEEVCLEYSHTLDSDYWTASVVPPSAASPVHAFLQKTK